MIWYHVWYHKQYHIICVHDIIHDIMIWYHGTYHRIWYMISCWFSMISYTQIIWYSVHLASLWYHRFFHDIICNIIVDIILWYHRYDMDYDIIWRSMISQLISYLWYHRHDINYDIIYQNYDIIENYDIIVAQGSRCQKCFSWYIPGIFQVYTFPVDMPGISSANPIAMMSYYVTWHNMT